MELEGPIEPGWERILTPDARAFVTGLVQAFRPRLAELLAARAARQARIDAGERLRFLPETAAVRSGDWTIAPVPADLQDRRVEITGPVDRKMVINALNSGANVFMADFEDSNSPTWRNVLAGQVNLYDAVRRTIAFTAPETGKHYELADTIATLMVRPRGWHLVERHATVDGEPVPAALFDFGLFFFHNAREQLARGAGPYFYLPKLESHLEARLWNDVFVHAQRALDVPLGTIKATVLIETIPAAFEMEEILHELRDHSAGLNCGRWDYIFSFIKKHRNLPGFVLPDRGQIGMTQPCMRAYTQLVVKVCHRRGAHAMGGMAAQIPIKGDPEANARAIEKVRADKLREVDDGHDGTWVAHPGLVPVAKAVFDDQMPTRNQVHRQRDDVSVTADDLLQVPTGTRTEAGLRQNVRVAVQYLDAWLAGNGCVPIDDLMEDAATAEISRAQIWQWIRHGAALEDGRVVTRALVAAIFDEEAAGRGRARELFERVCFDPEFAEFLTLPAYEALLSEE